MRQGLGDVAHFLTSKNKNYIIVASGGAVSVLSTEGRLSTSDGDFITDRKSGGLPLRASLPCRTHHRTVQASRPHALRPERRPREPDQGAHPWSEQLLLSPVQSLGTNMVWDIPPHLPHVPLRHGRSCSRPYAFQWHGSRGGNTQMPSLSTQQRHRERRLKRAGRLWPHVSHSLAGAN